jgi:hypothetical protein
MLVRHPPGLTRSDVELVLSRRWPGALISEVGHAVPSWPLSVVEMAELARLRRGVEPLRRLILAQRHANCDLLLQCATVPQAVAIDPMPVAF